MPLIAYVFKFSAMLLRAKWKRKTFLYFQLKVYTHHIILNEEHQINSCTLWPMGSGFADYKLLFECFLKEKQKAYGNNLPSSLLTWNFANLLTAVISFSVLHVSFVCQLGWLSRCQNWEKHPSPVHPPWLTAQSSNTCSSSMTAASAK